MSGSVRGVGNWNVEGWSGRVRSGDLCGVMYWCWLRMRLRQNLVD